MLRLKRLGRYLKGQPTSALVLEVEQKPEVLEAWVDADWGGSDT